ncbi:MAG: thiamine pyrophosphate-binding protein [Actinomycetota bacterium]|nr:MAG: acetolactate synthase I/II/III large [Actinomycetota bacterium]MDO8950806.1 thiamine pyrophosphate-binding protein [Actinomycetota bacterium]MDP3629938.1 thiamine pyrophosphate-binding protein [Actinomycetota bacterium]MDZ4232552.1 thiamine pyrophosphate-binding protein [Dietzia sp.]
MNATDYIAAFLAENGVTTVYEMTGGMITFILDSIGARDDITVVSMHHEQAAAFAAEAGARMTGVPGVALATSGPGATNLLTGIASCFFDSVPAVFITGQVNTYEQRGVSGVRQAGFQETDIVALAEPITKSAIRIGAAHELPEALARAFAQALAGRPGPVLVDIPMDVQRQDVSVLPERVTIKAPTTPDGVPQALRMLMDAERPVILAGGGIRTSRATDLLVAFAEATRIPVVSTLMGLDVLPFGHPSRVGMMGTYGNRWANLVMRDADCVLALGARFDVRQTGADVEAFRAGKTFVRVEVDDDQMNWRLRPDVAISGDIGAFLGEAMARIGDVEWPERAAWGQTVEGYRRDWPDAMELGFVVGISPVEVMQAVSSVMTDSSAVVVDVGQNQMWAAQSIRLAPGQRFITSGGMGAMGFAVPAAIGVAHVAPGRSVFVVVGDGGMQVNIQELETIVRLGLPIKIVVLNNSCLGMVRQLQDELFDSRYHSTMWGYGAPDFVAVAEAYGVPARRITEPGEVAGSAAWLAADVSGPALLEVVIDSATCVRPKVTFGNPVYVMDPTPTTEHEREGSS